MQPKAAQSKTNSHQVVSPAEWLAARKELLQKEKELTHMRDAVAQQRRELPWEKVAKDYTFGGPNGKLTLADVFSGKRQLIIYHFMFGPEWKEGCPSCSMVADNFDGNLAHLTARDVQLASVSRTPFAKIAEFKERMGWKFPWVSSAGSDFNFDFHVAWTDEERASGRVYYNYEVAPFPSEEGPGTSVFYKDVNGDIFHTYSTFARGGDHMIGAYNFLDIAPKGRNEEILDFPMAWVRHHDRYDSGVLADAARPYWPDQEALASDARTRAGHDCCSDQK
jgi:predicted dithiol-disulfide oxidoreductase (DUF899 family)